MTSTQHYTVDTTDCCSLESPRNDHFFSRSFDRFIDSEQVRVMKRESLMIKLRMGAEAVQGRLRHTIVLIQITAHTRK